jgi:hypothetical protein
VHFCYCTAYKREEQGRQRRITDTISSGQSVGEGVQAESSGQASSTYNCLEEFNIVVMMQHFLNILLFNQLFGTLLDQY